MPQAPQDVGFGFRFKRPTPVVLGTLVVLVVVWVVSALAVRFVDGGEEVYRSLTLQPDAVLHGQKLWGVLTSTFLHSLSDTDHLLFNGLVFYFFAPDLEELWGRARFLLFMLVTALGASAFVIGAVALGLSHTSSVVGFSGVVMGVTTAWGLTYPDREMFLLFFRLRGIHLVYVTIAMQILTGLSFSAVSASAHFGGMAAGALFAVTQSGPLRRRWLTYRLSRLQGESAKLHGTPAGRRPGPALRVIQGGGGDPPKDKRFLN